MSKYIECPEIYVPKEKITSIKNGLDYHFPNEIAIFLAGGITGCPDWQKEAADNLLKYYEDKNIIILNPRRKNFTMSPEIEREQITWEFNHLKKANIALFWFPQETLCPITLFEYGKWLEGTKKPVFVGCHDNYARKRDLIIQTELSRPLVRIWHDVYTVCSWLKHYIFIEKNKE